MGLPSLLELERTVRSLAARLGATDHILPTFGHSEDGARPHIEVDGTGLHYVVVERGKEVKRITTRDADELLWHVFEGVTFSLAGSFELTHRRSGRDSRRLMFAKQRELLEVLSPRWAERKLLEHEAILQRHPFDDMAAERARLAADLRRAGESPETAWRHACQRYPPPRS